MFLVVDTIYEWLIDFYQAFFNPVDPVWELMDQIIQVFTFIVMIGVICIPFFMILGAINVIRSIGGGRYDE